MLFLATVYTTFTTHQLGLIRMGADPAYAAQQGLFYCGALMFILTAHELGHFFQAVRYQVRASLPYFIPVPAGPIGTMGAVIAMGSGMGNRKALFDIGISGPLAGLVPAIVFSIIGLHWSEIIPGRGNLGDPLLLQFLVYLLKGPLPPGHDVALHPLAYAGWVGMLLTSVNLFPIGQLDGGHILYALLRRKAHFVAMAVLLAAVAAVVYFQKWTWTLMLTLLFVMGPAHPPTDDDDMPLGAGRVVLGVLTLLFVVIGFTPNPF